MTEALFQHIPRCLFEPVAVLGAIGLLLFFFRHWKKDKAETVLFTGTIAFMILWRVLLPIGADRYALLLIPVSIFMAVFAIEELVLLWRRFGLRCGRALFCAALLAACLFKSFHGGADGWYMFRMTEVMKNEIKESGSPVSVVSNVDLSCFLGDHCAVNTVGIPEPFRLSDLPYGTYYLLKLRLANMPADSGDAIFSKIYESPDIKSKKSGFYIWKREKRP